MARIQGVSNMVELKGAQMIGCEFCVDLGSQICRNSGFSDEELLAPPRYRNNDLFTEREQLALDYAVAVMRTPVEVTDELLAQPPTPAGEDRLETASWSSSTNGPRRYSWSGCQPRAWRRDQGSLLTTRS